MTFTSSQLAAEPLVIHPVAMDFDENGNISVAEAMSESNGLTHSRVVLLQDTNGGGKPDKRIFADQLPGICGIMSWKGGKIVATRADFGSSKILTPTVSPTRAMCFTRITRKPELGSRTRSTESITGST